jgi:hypothetical protein
MREYDLATVCKWIGNSPAVAIKHYASSVDLSGLRELAQLHPQGGVDIIRDALGTLIIFSRLVGTCPLGHQHMIDLREVFKWLARVIDTTAPAECSVLRESIRAAAQHDPQWLQFMVFLG